MPRIADRFRGFLPVVVDVETGGFNADTDALLEVAACIVRMDDFGRLFVAETIDVNVEPFEGANLDPKSLEITGIQVDNPLRGALPEVDALRKIFQPIRQELEWARALTVRRLDRLPEVPPADKPEDEPNRRGRHCPLRKAQIRRPTPGAAPYSSPGSRPGSSAPLGSAATRKISVPSRKNGRASGKNWAKRSLTALVWRCNRSRRVATERSRELGADR